MLPAMGRPGRRGSVVARQLRMMQQQDEADRHNHGNRHSSEIDSDSGNDSDRSDKTVSFSAKFDALQMQLQLLTQQMRSLQVQNTRMEERILQFDDGSFGAVRPRRRSGTGAQFIADPRRNEAPERQAARRGSVVGACAPICAGVGRRGSVFGGASNAPSVLHSGAGAGGDGEGALPDANFERTRRRSWKDKLLGKGDEDTEKEGTRASATEASPSPKKKGGGDEGGEAMTDEVHTFLAQNPDVVATLRVLKDSHAAKVRDLDYLSGWAERHQLACYTRLVILPKDTLKVVWDFLIAALVLLSLFLAPLQVAFDGIFAAGAAPAAFTWVVDGFFCLDVLLTFLTAYEMENMLIIHPGRICRRYLGGWFVVDTLAALPLDAILSTSCAGGCSSLGVADASAAARLVRLIRLVKLLRIFRLPRFLRAHSAQIHLWTEGVRPSTKRALYTIIFVVAIVNGITCAYWATVSFEWQDMIAEHGAAAAAVSAAATSADPLAVTAAAEQSTVAAARFQANLQSQWYPPDYVLQAAGYSDSTSAAPTEGTLLDLGVIYAWCFFWATALMSSYQDFIPVSQAQTAISLVTIILGFFASSLFVGQVTTTLHEMNAVTAKHKQRTNEVQQYLRAKDVPSKVRKAVAEFHDFTGFSGDRMLDDLPANLRLQLDLVMHRSLFLKVPAFKDCTLAQICELVPRIVRQYALSGQHIVREGQAADGLFMISRGHVLVKQNGREIGLLGHNDFFGERSIVTGAVEERSVLALELVELMVLYRKELQEVLSLFPELRVIIEGQSTLRDKEVARRAKEDEDAANKKGRSSVQHGRLGAASRRSMRMSHTSEHPFGGLGGGNPAPDSLAQNWNELVGRQGEPAPAVDPLAAAAARFAGDGGADARAEAAALAAAGRHGGGGADEGFEEAGTGAPEAGPESPIPNMIRGWKARAKARLDEKAAGKRRGSLMGLRRGSISRRGSTVDRRGSIGVSRRGSVVGGSDRRGSVGAGVGVGEGAQGLVRRTSHSLGGIFGTRRSCVAHEHAAAASAAADLIPEGRESQCEDVEPLPPTPAKTSHWRGLLATMKAKSAIQGAAAGGGVSAAAAAAEGTVLPPGAARRPTDRCGSWLGGLASTHPPVSPATITPRAIGVTTHDTPAESADSVVSAFLAETEGDAAPSSTDHDEGAPQEPPAATLEL